MREQLTDIEAIEPVELDEGPILEDFPWRLSPQTALLANDAVIDLVRDTNKKLKLKDSLELVVVAAAVRRAGRTVERCVAVKPKGNVGEGVAADLEAELSSHLPVVSRCLERGLFLFAGGGRFELSGETKLDVLDPAVLERYLEAVDGGAQ